MLKKTKDALRRADMIVASTFVLTLAMAGACAAYAPSTDEVAPRAVMQAVKLPTATQVVATDVPAPAVQRMPTPGEIAAMNILVKTECLADAMYYEARGEGTEGELAIAEVVYNRTRDGNYPRNVCGVVFEGSHLRTGCQFSFTCNGEMRRAKNPIAWRHARNLALRIVTGTQALGDLTGAATSFHAVEVQPVWSGTMERTTQIGNHIFYRPLHHSDTRGA